MDILLAPSLMLFLVYSNGLHAFGNVLQHMCQYTDTQSYYRLGGIGSAFVISCHDEDRLHPS